MTKGLVPIYLNAKYAAAADIHYARDEDGRWWSKRFRRVRMGWRDVTQSEPWTLMTGPDGLGTRDCEEPPEGAYLWEGRFSKRARLPKPLKIGKGDGL